MRSIGILGGTFNPIHNGHIACADAALNALNLDEVLFIVAPRPHFKQDEQLADPELRYQMVEQALMHHPSCTASRIELDRPGVTYTIDTLEALHDAYPQAVFTFIGGSDVFLHLTKWKDASRIAQMCSFACVERPENALSRSVLYNLKQEGFRIEQVQANMPNISSTNVRAQAHNTDVLATLVPQNVKDFIILHHLYGA